MSKHLFTLVALLLTACTGTPTGNSPMPAPTEVPTQTPTPTITRLPLQFTFNGGFEQDCLESIVHIADSQYRDNICSPKGWVTWWRQGHVDGGELGQPEVKLLDADNPLHGYDAELPRIHQGEHSVQLFTMYRVHEAGLYTIVAGLPPGQRIHFSAQAMGWTCNNDENIGYTCEHEWDQLVFSVGIDPHGYTNPMGWTVIWSDPIISPDKFNKIGPVEAIVGERGIVVLYLRSQAKWAFEHLDAYWDSALLEVPMELD